MTGEIKGPRAPIRQPVVRFTPTSEGDYSARAAATMDAMDQRVAKWKRWMDGPIKASVVTMNHHRQIWRGLAEVIEAHGSLPPSAYWEHYFDIYAETQAMAVRRQADLHRDAASLAKLLSEVSEDVKQLTPEWWIGLWRIAEGDDHERAFARRQWDNEFRGEVGKDLDPAIPATDLERLTGDRRL